MCESRVTVQPDSLSADCRVAQMKGKMLSLPVPEVTLLSRILERWAAEHWAHSARPATATTCLPFLCCNEASVPNLPAADAHCAFNVSVALLAQWSHKNPRASAPLKPVGRGNPPLRSVGNVAPGRCIRAGNRLRMQLPSMCHALPNCVTFTV